MTERFEKMHVGYRIEALVGMAWVPVADVNTPGEATIKQTKALAEDGVLKARVREITTTIVSEVVSIKEREIIFKAPEKMKYTGQDQACPLCKINAPVHSDGQHSFTFCAKCKRATPA